MPWGLDFHPHTHPIPTEKPVGKPTESPYSQKHEILYTHTLCLFVRCIFLNRSYAVHVTVLLCVGLFTNDNEENASKTNYKLECLWRNSSKNLTFIACFVRFRLISQPFENLHRIPTDPRGFITSGVVVPERTGTPFR